MTTISKLRPDEPTITPSTDQMPAEAPTMTPSRLAADEMQVLIHRLGSTAKIMITEEIDALQQQLRAFEAREQQLIAAVGLYAVNVESVGKVHKIVLPPIQAQTAEVERGLDPVPPRVITERKAGD